MTTSDIFALDPRLAADSFPVMELRRSTLLLMNDARYPWLILVPRVPGAVELIDLDPAVRAGVMHELDRVARELKRLTNCHKLNVAALGNMVRQLHLHVIARFEADAAWPNPVWGRGSPVPYASAAAQDLIAPLRAALEDVA
ncbi:HIT domain-containing protein [Ancylobacter oerskovii]|uniref:HIT domain-containing protein n=1 Tax=Ancylobacter oerskovii TaxID=459519 RepID=A0ABW4YWJ9_9HYPH|nr:HIT family protein [Ancylobacter oerskovii]MBS7542327.1 HIT domain-containing protein [Ancylobacter oerskovii]